MEIEIKQSAYKHGCTYDDIINFLQISYCNKDVNQR